MAENRGGEFKIRQIDDGVEFTVKAVPRASKTAVAGVLGDKLKVKLAAVPEKGKANELLIVFLAEMLGVKRNDIAITSGHSSPVKVILIKGITADTVCNKLKL